MHGRKRRFGALVGLLVFIAFVLGLIQIPSRAAFAGDGLGTAVLAMLFVLVIIIVSLSGAIAGARHLMREPATRSATAFVSVVGSAIIGVGFIAMVVIAVVR